MRDIRSDLLERVALMERRIKPLMPITRIRSSNSKTNVMR